MREEEEGPIPQPGKHEVQLAIHSVGICGTDVHVLTEGSLGQFVLTDPMVSGHEASGTVRQVGEGVTHLAVGDRVAVEPGISCRYCTNCKAGRYYLCPHLEYPVHGLMCRYKAHPADLCYKLPDNVSLEEGALLEPLSVAVHACSRAGITVGYKVFISGAGQDREGGRREGHGREGGRREGRRETGGRERRGRREGGRREVGRRAFTLRKPIRIDFICIILIPIGGRSGSTSFTVNGVLH
ncbi:hypothetical protein Bbelb_157440 [Branchiostoma belcheri]|nr:hypothetical protein Bbelb_157440 [Branchiostoma belcheri]